MKNRAFRKPVIIGTAAAPLVLLVAVGAAGALNRYAVFTIIVLIEVLIDC
jgi:hypothetical protein